MNIIAGSARGMNIEVPPGLTVRPTSDRARKALFDSLGEFSGKVVADLFSGSGAMGLEAASRGASRVLFFDNDPRHCEFIRRNIERMSRVPDRINAELFCADATKANLNAPAVSPDLIFADPPYAVSGACFRAVVGDPAFAAWAAGSLMVWELPSGEHDFMDFSASGPFERSYRNFCGINFMLMRWHSK